VHESWPNTPFIHKQDGDFYESCHRFTHGLEVRESAEFRLEIDRSREPVDLRFILEDGAAYKQVAGETLCELSDFLFVPTMSQLAATTGKGHANLTRQLKDVKNSLKSKGQLPAQHDVTLQDLWRWARARRPLLAAIYKAQP